MNQLVFLLQGDHSFRLPASLGLLTAALFLSLVQAIALFTLRDTRNQDDAQQRGYLRNLEN